MTSSNDVVKGLQVEIEAWKNREFKERQGRVTAEWERDTLRKRLDEAGNTDREALCADLQSQKSLIDVLRKQLAGANTERDAAEAARDDLQKQLDNLPYKLTAETFKLCRPAADSPEGTTPAEKKVRNLEALVNKLAGESNKDIVAERDELKRQLDKCEGLVEGWHTERDRELAARKYAEAHADKEHRARLEVETKLALAITAPVYVTDPSLVAERDDLKCQLERTKAAWHENINAASIRAGTAESERDKITRERDSLQQRLATAARLKDAAEYQRDELKRQLADRERAIAMNKLAAETFKLCHEAADPEGKAPTADNPIVGNKVSHPVNKTIRLTTHTYEGTLEQSFNVEEDTECLNGDHSLLLKQIPFHVRFVPK
jgi:hypothetical protein